MKTSELIVCESTRNGVSIFEGNKYKYFFKQHYIDVFETIATSLKTQKRDIIKLWHEIVDSKINTLSSDLKKEFSNITDSDIQRILNKFRGNLGEIFAEKFFSEGYAGKYVKTSSYTPVDPKKEKSSNDWAKIDATATSGMNGSLIGIQVKNFKSGDLVSRDVFLGVCAQIAIWDHQTNIEETFGSVKREYDKTVVPMIIFSFTEAATSDLITGYDKIIKFIGPSVISKAKLHDSPIFFEEIIEELKKI